MRHSSMALLLVFVLALIVDGCASARPRGYWEPTSRDRVYDPLTHEPID